MNKPSDPGRESMQIRLIANSLSQCRNSYGMRNKKQGIQSLFFNQRELRTETKWISLIETPWHSLCCCCVGKIKHLA